MSAKLTESEAKAFVAVNQRLGLGPTETTFAQKHLKKKGEVHLCSDPLSSHIPPKLVLVGSITELNKLVGIVDEQDDSHVKYPTPAPKSHLNLFNSASSSEDFRHSVTAEMHEE